MFLLGVNEISTTFLYTLNRGDKKTAGEKKGFVLKRTLLADLFGVIGRFT